MYEECRHIKTSGTKCGSPALKGRAYCYFHFRAHQQRHRTVDHYAAFVAHKFDVAVLEDRAAIQLAISETVSAMANNYMDHKRGGKILYGLQLALQGMKHPEQIVAAEPVRDLCQNAEGEDIADQATVYEEGEKLPTDHKKPEEHRSEAKPKPDSSGEPPKIPASAEGNVLGAQTKPKTIREAIAACISELKRRNPNVRRSRALNPNRKTNLQPSPTG
jgi:hypothetical protein